MNILILLIAFLAPMIVAELYSSRHYELSFTDHLRKWKLGKYLALLLACLYLLALMTIEPENSDSIFSALCTGAFLSLVIYSQSFGEIFLKHAAEFKRVGLLDDAAFIIGWISLIYEVASYLLYL
ncbi:hypothetical protein L1077_26900 [Pseudoalteromonas luteoviolacea]|uniref:hypothetical protein n=1 Tax=Pseudoalteromonas luteoviolacea TaxID=43657 RepID=UPI001F22C8D7|nr:hypothetical protein [Pseudoalteromonas luteoviolacea]MCF6443059.1 hypothetical protein [Pseudoalteromonas luteoviolacea]